MLVPRMIAAVNFKILITIISFNPLGLEVMIHPQNENFNKNLSNFNKNISIALRLPRNAFREINGFLGVFSDKNALYITMRAGAISI